MGLAERLDRDGWGASCNTPLGSIKNRYRLKMDNQPIKRPLLKKWWVWVLIVVAVFGVIGSIGDSESGSTASAPRQEVQEESAIAVTAVKLATEYKDNQVAADIKYKDKIVEVSGTVETIGKDILEDSYVFFEGAGIVNRIQCYVSKANEASIASLASGQKVTMRGRVDGGTFNVIVKNCEVVQ